MNTSPRSLLVVLSASTVLLACSPAESDLGGPAGTAGSGGTGNATGGAGGMVGTSGAAGTGGGAGRAGTGGSAGNTAGGSGGNSGGGGGSAGSGGGAGGSSTGAAGNAAGRGGNGGSGGSTGGAGGSAAGRGGSTGGGGGGGATGGTGVPSPASGLAPAHNGLRGQSLNSGWRFNRGDVTGAQATTFNDSAWMTKDLPHDWSIELAFNANSPGGANNGYLDGGVGWYRKAFTVDQASSGQRILIQFDGVYMNSEVWINGTSLGTRPVRLHQLRIRPHAQHHVRRQQRHRRPREQQPAEQPLVLGQRHLPQCLADEAQPGSRPLQRRVRLDAFGLERVGDGVGQHRGAEPVDRAPPPSR